MDLSPDPLPEQAPPPPAGRGRDARRPAAAHLPRPAARPGLPVRDGAASAASPAATRRPSSGRRQPGLRRGPVPLGPPRRQRVHQGAARPPRPARDRASSRCWPDLDGASRPPELLGRRRAMLEMMRGRARPGRRLRHREPRRARRSTCTPRSASSTTRGPRSARTTSTAGPGPTTRSCPRS